MAKSAGTWMVCLWPSSSPPPRSRRSTPPISRRGWQTVSVSSNDRPPSPTATAASAPQLPGATTCSHSGHRSCSGAQAVFVGSFDLGAAESVCAHPGLDIADVVSLLGELVSNSLVVRDTAGRTERYRLLETVRVYALERLDVAGERQAVSSTHAAWCLELAETASTHALAVGRATARYRGRAFGRGRALQAEPERLC